jgi:hypothetical protein
MLEQLEDKRRRYLIRGVCNAEIEKWQLYLNRIALDKLKFVLVTEFIDSLADLSYHSRVDFNSDSLFASLKE